MHLGNDKRKNKSALMLEVGDVQDQQSWIQLKILQTKVSNYVEKR